MIGEAMIAIKALDSAFSLVKNSIDKSKDVAAMGSEIGKFMSAKAAVEKQMEDARNNGGDIFAGSALEEAITLDAQEQRLEKMMSRIGNHYRTQGRTGAWIKIKNEAKKIEASRDKARRAKLRKAEETDDLLKSVASVFAIVFAGLGLTALIVFTIFGISAE